MTGGLFKGENRQRLPACFPRHLEAMGSPAMVPHLLRNRERSLSWSSFKRRLPSLERSSSARRRRFKNCLPLHLQTKKAMPPPSMRASRPRKQRRRMELSLLTTLLLSITIACLPTTPSPLCTSASHPVSMGQTMPNGIM
jgi:uncharacterized paraquat-inducible protein A